MIGTSFSLAAPDLEGNPYGVELEEGLVNPQWLPDDVEKSSSSLSESERSESAKSGTDSSSSSRSSTLAKCAP